MSTSDPLKPSRIVAILPFSLSATPPTPAHADLCRGLTGLAQRRLSRLSGVQAIPHRFLMAPESDQPGRSVFHQGWLLPNSLWTMDQVLSMPFGADDVEPTHVLQGIAIWGEEDSLRIEMQLIDLSAAEVVAHEVQDGKVADLPTAFFRTLAGTTTALMGSHSAGRVVSRIPTRNAEAFREFVLAIAQALDARHQLASGLAALEHLGAALRLDGDFLEAENELERLAGEMLEASSDPQPVLEALDRVRAATPGFPTLVALLGCALSRLNQEERATVLLEEYLRAEPRGERASQVMTALARIHRRRNELTAARRLLQAALVRDPEDAAAWEELADCHLAAGDPMQAEECWRRALQEDPDRVEPLLRLGSLFLSRGDFPRSGPLLERAHGLSPGPRTLAPLLEVLCSTHRLDEADVLATEWVEEHEGAMDAWLALAQIRRRRGDMPAAEHCLERARRLATNRIERQRVAMETFAVRQPLEHAEYRRIVRLRDLDKLIAESYARKLSAGVYDRANLPELRHLSARLYAAAGRWTEAVAQQQKLCDLVPGEVGPQLQLAEWQVDALAFADAETTLTHAAVNGAPMARLDQVRATLVRRRELEALVQVEPAAPAPAAPVTASDEEPAGFFGWLRKTLASWRRRSPG